MNKRKCLHQQKITNNNIIHTKIVGTYFKNNFMKIMYFYIYISILSIRFNLDDGYQ